MGKGVFLKENRSQEQSVTGQRTSRDKSGVKTERLRKQKRSRRLAGIGLLAALLILAVVMVIVLTGDPLMGRWNMDAVTSYEFSRNGKGTLILPSAQYDFTYTIDDNVLNIDFDYDGAKDAQYTFTVDGDVLTLDGGNSTTQGIYELTRSK